MPVPVQLACTDTLHPKALIARCAPWVALPVPPSAVLPRPIPYAGTGGKNLVQPAVALQPAGVDTAE